MRATILKTAEPYFSRVMRREKTAELRFNDRNYHVGQVLYLREWDGSRWGRRYIRAIIKDVEDYPDALRPGWVMLSFQHGGTFMFTERNTREANRKL